MGATGDDSEDGDAGAERERGRHEPDPAEASPPVGAPRREHDRRLHRAQHGIRRNQAQDSVPQGLSRSGTGCLG